MNNQQPSDASGPIFYRATFSLPADLATGINRLAKRLSISQSGLVAELLGDPVQAMLAILDEIPQVGATPDQVKRARGKSAAVVRHVVNQAQALLSTELADDDSHS